MVSWEYWVEDCGESARKQNAEEFLPLGTWHASALDVPPLTRGKSAGKLISGVVRYLIALVWYIITLVLYLITLLIIVCYLVTP